MWYKYIPEWIIRVAIAEKRLALREYAEHCDHGSCIEYGSTGPRTQFCVQLAPYTVSLCRYDLGHCPA